MRIIRICIRRTLRKILDIDYLIYLYCVYRLIVISVKKSRFSKINMKIILCPTFLAITIIRFVFDVVVHGFTSSVLSLNHVQFGSKWDRYAASICLIFKVERLWSINAMEWVSDCWLTPIQQLFSYIMARTVNFKWDDDEVRFVLDQHAELDFYSASSLKQQSACIHVAALGHIILISSQPVLALSPYILMMRAYRGSNKYQFYSLWFDSNRLVPTIYHTRGEAWYRHFSTKWRD